MKNGGVQWRLIYDRCAADVEPGQLRYCISPNGRGLTQCLIQNTAPKAMHRQPTVRYAIPRKSFLPPNHEVVLNTTAFSPLNAAVGNWLSTKTCTTSPALKPSGKRAHNFLNVGKPAVRIQTMKCSSSIPSLGGEADGLSVPCGVRPMVRGKTPLTDSDRLRVSDESATVQGSPFERPGSLNFLSRSDFHDISVSSA